MNIPGRSRLATAIAIAGLVASQLTPLIQGVRADTFVPASAGPIVNIQNYPGPMQPGYPDSTYGPGEDTTTNTEGSGDTYWISAQIVSTNGTVDTTSATLCVYMDGNSGECGSESPDPRYALVILWERPSGSATTGGSSAFSKRGTNNYLVDSASAWADEDAFTTTVDWFFAVSDAMHAGTGNWNARVVAVNKDGLSNPGDGVSPPNNDLIDTLSVSYFGWVTTGRTPMDFGTISPGESSTASATGLGGFIANDASAIYLQASDFTYLGALGSATIDLTEGTVGEMPDVDQVALDCSAGSTYADTDAIRVRNSPLKLQTGLFTEGTGETQDDTLTHTCRLTYGGPTRSLGTTSITKVEYSTKVYVGIGDAGLSAPYAGSDLTSGTWWGYSAPTY